jgi:hypothetical protein
VDATASFDLTPDLRPIRSAHRRRELERIVAAADVELGAVAAPAGSR